MKKCPICQAQYEDTDDFCLEHPEAILQVVTAKTSAENPSSPKTEQTQKQDYSQKKSPQPEMERHFSEHQDTGNLVKFCSVCQRQYAESFDYCVDHPDVLLERLHHDAGHQSQSQTDNQHTTGTSTSNKQSADNSHQQPQEETTPDSPFAESAQETPTGFGAATTNNTTNNGDQVDDLFAEMNGRSSSDGTSQNTASAKSTTDNQTALQLPTQLLADGWALTSEIPFMTAAFSRYQIQRGEEKAYFTLYSVGSLTSVELYAQLVNHTPSWLTPVLYHGTLTSHGQILTYDVTTSLNTEFQPLKEWLKTNPSEQRAL
nr:hypothetical protein [Agitococcus sp.]